VQATRGATGRIGTRARRTGRLLPNRYGERPDKRRGQGGFLRTTRPRRRYRGKSTLIGRLRGSNSSGTRGSVKSTMAIPARSAAM